MRRPRLRVWHRPGDHTFVLLLPRSAGLGATIWHHGALTLQAGGHMASLVLGDWWRADNAAAERAKHPLYEVRVRLDGRESIHEVAAQR